MPTMLGASKQNLWVCTCRILLGSLINAFNPSGGTTGNVTDDINNVCLQFVYVAIGTGIASYLEVGPCTYVLCTVPYCHVSKYVPAAT